jgi:E3 ubiquitin-protein ligase HUWE1
MISFLTMGKKRGGKESLFALARPRTAILNFMLLELVCCTGLADQVPPTKPSLKKAMDLANCAMTVLVALCSDVGLGTDLKDTPVDLVAVRKVVLDALSKAIKDATSSAEHVDVRYGRLHSLSDLCYRLLTARPNIQPKGQEDGSLHIAKVMLEKNFAVALTNALAEVDLNYPDVKLVVLDILKPLEHLFVLRRRLSRLPLTSSHVAFPTGPRFRSRWAGRLTRRRTPPTSTPTFMTPLRRRPP